MHVTVCGQLPLIVLFRVAECILFSQDHTNLTQHWSTHVFTCLKLFIESRKIDRRVLRYPVPVKRRAIFILPVCLPIMKAIDIQLLQEEILKYTNCSEFTRLFHGDIDVWLASLGGVLSQVLEISFGVSMGENSSQDDDKVPNCHKIKEITLSLQPWPLCLSSDLP